MEEKRPVGRPSKGIVWQLKSFKLRVDLAKELETFPNQTQVIEEALEIYFNMQGKSEQWLLKRREELRKKLDSIDTTLRTKDKEKRDKEIKAEQERAKEQYFAEMYEQLKTLEVEQTPKQYKSWCLVKLKPFNASIEEFEEYCNGRDK